MKLLFIVGYPHSGTTILGNVLGEIEGFFHAGEVTHLWERNLLDGKRRCGCGVKTRDCPLWSRVLSDGLGEHSRVRRTHEQHRRYVRSSSIPRLLATSPRRALERPGLGDYLRTLVTLYGQIAGATGATVIVDSSKLAADAAAVRLLRTEGIDPYFVHLVRDPLDVACSRQRKIAGPGLDLHLPLLLYDSCRWSALTAAATAVCLRQGRARSLLLPYERFAGQPRRSVADILELVGESSRRVPVEDDATVMLHGNHTLGGNRNRFRAGHVAIRPSRPSSTPRVVARLCSRALTGPITMALGLRRGDHARPTLDRNGSSRPPAQRGRTP